MAKAAKPSKNALVIVESPAKARTISKYLGSGYTVEASIGHVRDLPHGAKEMPEQFKNEEWSYLGVNVNENFEPVYIVPPGKKQQVTKLKKLLKEADELYLATDEDREGEAISWHLQEILQPKVPVKRLVFHEITKEAILNAVAHPRMIDDGLVRAQETRRILDRLYGYEVSPLLWYKVRPRLSAGRVQSVAVRLIVERERERMAFHSATYWDLVGTFIADGKKFNAVLTEADGRRIPSGKDFDTTNGQLKNPAAMLLLDEAGAESLLQRLQSAQFSVESLENKPFTNKPAAPFTTSTLQQEANRKLGFTARHTMRIAQSLYENGHITYMRTDSTNLAEVAIDAARDLVKSEYGADYLPEKPRVYASKVKNAQEAHEAIRPAGHPFQKPEALKGTLNNDEFRLFELIWKRTIASQMSDARGFRIAITLGGGGAKFYVSGKTIEFPGFLRAYVEGSDDPDAELADRETLLPAMRQGQPVDKETFEPKSHTTQPPARFSEASLTRALEEMGIGRPSTYASIIDTILDREYVFKKGTALAPTWLGFAVAKLLEEHLPKLIDYQFTAKMEDDLDAISRGEADQGSYLRDFYFGQDEHGLKEIVQGKIKDVDARVVNSISLGKPANGQFQDEVVVRVGRYGPFVEQGERRGSIPSDLAPDEVTLDKALELLDKAQLGDEPLGYDPATGRPVFIKTGRFGDYVQLGLLETDEEPVEEEAEEKPKGKKKAADKEKPKNASLLKGMQASDITLEVALKLLSLPREVGVHPESNEPIISQNGRFGPYIKCGAETRSLGDISPVDVTLEQALALLAQPKAAGRGRGAAKEPLRTFEASPVTEEPIKLMEGRYGPYLTDGQTNASLPKGVTVEEVTLDQALALLADRAAKAPPKKKKATKKASAKKATPKKTATKKATTKKTTKKATAEKKPKKPKNTDKW
ncbi:type I DNA topoisomerase [Blastopirellula sp. JC732]|uniref:DNA topoisomerase 1 n=1 Tax=Blastopirellula sediminis TaxID=2894196 RepID=A0A9X1MMV1_9BACT|nr:type I DNA topoisomerase [Blastopirellula sediminis]MCC9608824.1 type I DNA topoisomerase [Blastopirellula sediminis]MCC9628399.1 type I DNA topoisomerase [Blastopirellula sediminis]